MEWKEQMTQKGHKRNLPQKEISEKGTQKFLFLHKFMFFYCLVGCSLSSFFGHLSLNKYSDIIVAFQYSRSVKLNRL